MNIKKLEPKVEKRTDPFEFYEVLDLLSQNTGLAFTCEEFDKGQYIGFGLSSKLKYFYEGTEIVDDDNKSEVTIKINKINLQSRDFIITLDCFKREWKSARLQDINKIYSLKVTYDYSFSEDDVISSSGKPFSSLTKEEVLNFLYEIAEDVIGEKPQFFIDGKSFL